MLLFYNNSPKKSEFYKYYSLKRREFDEIVVFSAGSEKSSVLGVHDFSGSAEKAKYRELSPFLCFDNDGQYHRQLLVILVYELANGFADYRL